jgi:dipeptidyl aminopeptidase/acylaminoacyl peptidase
MKPEHLPLLNSVSAPAVHPDGTRAVVSVVRPDFDSDSYVGQLWSVPRDPEKLPRRVTRGFRDTAPAFSPDGRVLAFLRAAPGGPPQLHVVEAAGGEPQALTDRKMGVSSFAWSPDSNRIVFGSREPEAGRYGTLDGVGSGAEDARFIQDYKYRMNGEGYTRDKPLQLFLLDVPELGGEPWVKPVGRAAKRSDSARRKSDGESERPDQSGEESGGFPEARRLTTSPTDHTGATFSSDGSAIYFVAALHEDADHDLVSGIYRVAADGGTPVLVPVPNLGAQTVSDVRESADGRWLFFAGQDLGSTRQDFVAKNTVLYVMPTGGGDATALSDAENMDVEAPGATIGLRGKDSALVLNNAQGTVELLEFSATGDHSLLVHGDRVVAGAGDGAGTVFLSYSDAATAGDVAVLEDGQLRLLSDFSAALRTEAGIIEPQELTFPAPDGYPVHGWLVLPPGKGPHPVLLNIHGGPFAQYTTAFFDEAQVYAAAGYAVLMCNPRGSAGYGQAHGRSIKERMGTVDMQDVLAFLDGSLEKFSSLDAGALGIMGGSYGGYLTAWTISQDHRFQAAIVERGFLDPVSFTGSSDIGWFFGGEYVGSAAELVAAQSPMATVAAVRTPTLVIHSEDDLRCPVEQGQRYFTALKQQGVDSGFLVFPGEDHELSRSGTPHHRRQRFEHILAWWAKYLPTDSKPHRHPGKRVSQPRVRLNRLCLIRLGFPAGLRAGREAKLPAGGTNARFGPARGVLAVGAERAELGPIDIEPAVQMVGFVLHDPRLPAAEVLGDLAAVGRYVLQPHAFGTFHHCLQSGERQAAFEEGGGPVAEAGIRRIQHGEELQRRPTAGRSRGLVNLELVLEDGQLQRNTQLRRRQADAGRGVHDLPHQDDQLGDFVRFQLALEGSGVLPQDRVPSLHDGWQALCGQQFLHCFPDAGGAVGRGRRSVGHGDSLMLSCAVLAVF